MMPPLVRRCPRCGYVGFARRFVVVDRDDGRVFVECPRCSHQFEAVADPRLQ